MCRLCRGSVGPSWQLTCLAPYLAPCAVSPQTYLYESLTLLRSFSLCGVSAESPQWRRGPPAKPMLCNACGTRYRRTNQLGPPVPSTRVTTPAQASNKKRPALHATNAAKKTRCGPASVHDHAHKALAAF